MATPSSSRRAKPGVAPLVLAGQVSSTAGWALEDADPHGVGATLAAVTVRDATNVEAKWKADPACVEYLRLLLSAHYLTVGTFCPTDVDARIRHHYWNEIESADALLRALDEVDAIAALDPRRVSARVLVEGGADAPRDKTLSGHDGEWFSVRAGALGQALVMSAGGAAEVRALVERLESAIEDELAREARFFEACLRSGDATRALSAATTIAHNVGDLSRVVEEWPRGAATEAMRGRYARLGHEPDRSRFDGAFFVAGALNKSLMAIENHRFLALRAPKALRRSRALLLPIGPFFHAWGRTIARALEDEKERAEVLTALVETHLSRVEQQGVLRAIAGLADANQGPWDKLVAHLPARLRKIATTGAVQIAIKTPEAAFLGRLENRFKPALKEAEQARGGARSK